ncbi:hypothetical protein J4434_08995 [Candidatus Woesearchaeota archaeon]|nr:hypothetical protein [Candidatus Woesearchaeota archaeon]
MKINKTILFGAIIGALYGLIGFLYGLGGHIYGYSLPKPLLLFFIPPAVFTFLLISISSAILKELLPFWVVVPIILFVIMLFFSLICILISLFIVKCKKRKIKSC